MVIGIGYAALDNCVCSLLDQALYITLHQCVLIVMKSIDFVAYSLYTYDNVLRAKLETMFNLVVLLWEFYIIISCNEFYSTILQLLEISYYECLSNQSIYSLA